MQLIPYEGLPDLPRHLWKRIYTPEEKEKRRKYWKLRSEKIRANEPDKPPKILKTETQARAKALAYAAWNSVGRAVPRCHGRQERLAIDEMYLQAVQMSEASWTQYSVDHIYPLSGQKYGVCGLHVKANMAIIPLKENMAKNNHPHASWDDYGPSP